MNGIKSRAIDREPDPKTQQHEKPYEKSYFNKFSTNGFLSDHNAEFDEEFDRLAEHMRWLKLGKAYKRHYSQALEQQREVSPQIQKSAIRHGLQKDGPGLFFERFVGGGFTRATNSSFDVEFNRLAQYMGWSKKSKEFRKHKIIATKQEITSSYGRSSQLEGWQQLCDDVGIEPVPSSIKKCKEELAKLYINLYDLIDWQRQPSPRPPFEKHKPTLRALQNYSIKSNRIFPKEAAKEEGFIKSLLRHIFH